MNLYFIYCPVLDDFLFTFVLFFPQSEGVTSGQTEDARRLAHRAISYRPAMTAGHREPVIKPAMMVAPPPGSGHHVPVTRAMVGLTTHHGPVDRADSGIGGGSASGSSPTTSLDMVSRDVGGLSIQVRNIVCVEIRMAGLLRLMHIELR